MEKKYVQNAVIKKEFLKMNIRLKNKKGDVVANVQENVCYFTPKYYNRHILKKWNAICIDVDILEKLKKLNVNFIIFNIINHPELRCPQYITTLKMYELKGIAINY